MTKGDKPKIYKVGDVISDLNVMIQEALIPNKQRCQLAEIVSDLKHVDPDENWGEKGIDYLGD